MIKVKPAENDEQQSYLLKLPLDWLENFKNIDIVDQLSHIPACCCSCLLTRGIISLDVNQNSINIVILKSKINWILQYPTYNVVDQKKEPFEKFSRLKKKNREFTRKPDKYFRLQVEQYSEKRC